MSLLSNAYRGGQDVAAKHWAGLFFAIAIALATSGAARAEPQYYVSYVELLPSGVEASPSGRPHGAQLLDQLAAAALTIHNNGATRFDVDQEIGRANFYLLIETWPSEDAHDTFYNSSKAQAILTALQPFLEAPFDVRQGILLETGVAGQAGKPGEIAIVTHIDIIPTFLAKAQPLIQDFVTASANDAGVKEFILVSWRVNGADITNHFQLIERFQNQRTFDLHLSAESTIEFRNSVQPFIGAPYDERVYNTHP